MRVATVVHQQVSQIKWHALACLALIMVLPLEEATASLLDGGGFYALAMVMPSIMLGPLLAGLIACANVQADLNDRRYIFWRSKPVGVKRFIALKYATGLIIALAIQACPIVFAIVTGAIFDEKRHMGEQMRPYIMLPALLSVMTYSLCFASNVLVRKTARSWLIGMAVACLLLLLPFVLPLGYKDFVSDVLLWVSGFYLAIMLVGSVGAFVFAILAAQYDLHLKTNLKGLLWTGAAVVFGLMMFAGGQVANIKVLAEVETPGRGRQLENVGGQIVLRGQGYLDVDNNALSFRTATDSDDEIPNYPPPTYNHEQDGYHVGILPYYYDPKLYKIGDDIYSFSVYDYYVEEETEDHKGKTQKVRIHEKLYLRCFKFADGLWTMVFEFDLADYMRVRTDSQYAVLGLTANRLVVFVNRSCLVLDVAEPSKPKVIEKKIDLVKRPVILRGSHPEQLAIPLIPLESLEMELRVKLSINRNFRYFRYRSGDVFEPSIVDMHDGEISFYLVSKKEIVRYDVARWDDEKIYCRRSTARPFTILEDIASGDDRYYNWFVKNGQLYLPDESTLMVFDVRHNRQMRKTGHFVRMRSWIEGLEVLDDGNMLLTLVNQGRKRGANSYQRAVYLLENPG